MNNEWPSSCTPIPGKTCNYVSWNANPDWQPGWCDLAETCELKALPRDFKVEVWKKKGSTPTPAPTQEDADYKKLTYPTADCGSGYAPLTQSECKAVPGYDYQRELSYDKNWIGGCFEWYRYSNGENTKKLYFNKGNAVEGKIGGNKICKKVKEWNTSEGPGSMGTLEPIVVDNKDECVGYGKGYYLREKKMPYNKDWSYNFKNPCDFDGCLKSNGFWDGCVGVAWVTADSKKGCYWIKKSQDLCVSDKPDWSICAKRDMFARYDRTELAVCTRKQKSGGSFHAYHRPR